jgi:radical SAM superfamily enzyme
VVRGGCTVEKAEGDGEAQEGEEAEGQRKLRADVRSTQRLQPGGQHAAEYHPYARTHAHTRMRGSCVWCSTSSTAAPQI